MMEKISIDDKVIAYESNKRHRDNTLLFLHSDGQNHTMWDPYIDHLNNFNTVAVDLCGHGPTLIPDLQDYRYENLADYVQRVLDKEEINNCSIIGHSAGTVIGQTIAGKDNSRVDSLTLMSSIYDIPELVENSFKLKFGNAALPLIDFLFRLYNKAAGSFVERPEFINYGDKPYRNVSGINYMLLQGALLKEESHKYGQKRAIEIRSWETAELPSKVDCPTLLITGEKDQFVPPKEAQKIAKEIPDSKVIIIPEIGHEIGFHPDLVLPHIDNFLEEVYANN